ncbi:hypothetical protein V1478_016467 [Vespula squamosa]|uniref:Uncharacterized protein n=1 Tax=Vespula squamosa TaxID=30214 RepID=A0ABD1ZZV0_VESSQ
MTENSSSESNEKIPAEEEVKEEVEEVENEEAAEGCDAEESGEEDNKDGINKRTKRNIIQAPSFTKKDDKTGYRLDANGKWRSTNEPLTTESSNETKPQESIFQIITVPGKRCPSGQRQDSNGVCRTVVPL